MTFQWPKQSQCDKFYGNPRGKNGHANPKWEAANLVYVKLPIGFGMMYEKTKVTQVRVHKKVADAVKAAFNALWLLSGKSAAKLKEWGISIFSGAYNFRLMRTSNRLSMHSYGIALDFDGGNRPLGSKKFFPPEVIKCFTDQGATNLKNDPMHFQFAFVD